jgi:hypothetical protein
MGCVCVMKPRKDGHFRRREMTNELIEIKKAKKSYFHATKCWLHIVDFLSYKDLREVGKLNKYIYLNIDLSIIYQLINSY